MMGSEKYSEARGFLTPPPKWRPNRYTPPPIMPRSERKPRSSVNDHHSKNDLFHVIHKVPAGDSPYVKAKHVQVIDKDPNRAVSMFWAAINAGDRVESALKDMAIVMKQLDRSDEAIEAIKSFRDLCPLESQESLDNILIELYKKSGRIEEEIQMLHDKIKDIEEGIVFDGRRTKLARSQGKRVEITIEKEYSRLLGNLAWALLQLEDYKSAADAYRKALLHETDKNKMCNLAICLIHLNKMEDAKYLLQTVRASCNCQQMDESHVKSLERATQILDEFELLQGKASVDQNDRPGSERWTNYGTRYERQFRTGRMGGELCSSNAYVSPGSLAATPIVPFTQPRKCLWPHREDTAHRCNRKLTFGQHKGCRDSHFLMREERNNDMEFKSRNASDCGNWRKVIPEEYTKATSDELQNAGNAHFTSLQQVSIADCGLSSTTVAADEKNNQILLQTNSNTNNSSARMKKTWAEMVEEEDDQLLLTKSLDFPDENYNTNIVPETPPASSLKQQPQNLEQKVSSGLKHGYYTQPLHHTTASVNQAMGKSIFFGEHQNSELSVNDSDSPLQKRALDFQSINTSASYVDDIKLMRRNRLEVFRNITPESPRF